MRRGSIVLFLVALLAGAAVLAALLAAAALAPERLRQELEGRLSEVAGAPVSLAEVRLALDRGLRVEVLGGETLRPDGMRLRVELLTTRLDPVALAVGRVSLGPVEVAGVELLLAHREPRVSVERFGDAAPAELLLAALGALAEQAAELRLPTESLQVTGARVGLTSRAGEPDSASWLLADARAAWQRHAWLGRSELSFAARVGEDGRSGALALEALATGDGLRAEVSLEDVELRALAPAVEHAGGDPTGLRGRVGGRLDWAARPGRPHRLEVALAARDLADGSLLPADAAPGEQLGLQASLALSPASLEILEARLTQGGATLHAEGRLALPVADRSALRLAVQVEGLSLSDLPALAAQLPATARERLPPLFASVESGELQRLRVEGDASLATWRELAGGRLLVEPGALTLGLEVVGVRLRVGTDDVVEQVRGRVDFDGDAVILGSVHGVFRGTPLPVLDGVFRGLSHIRSPDELNCVPPPPVAKLPGVGELLERLSDPADEPGDWGWQRVAVEADWISHPMLLCSLEQVAAEVRPADQGLDVVLERGVWAGVPVSGQVAYREGPAPARVEPEDGGAPPPAHVAFQVTIGPPFEGMSLDPPSDPWLRGRFEAETSHFGPWRIRAGRGRLRASGATLHLEEASVDLSPGGALSGQASLDLGVPGELPVRLAARAEGIEILDLLQALGVESDFLSGTLHGAATLQGRLEPGRSLLETSDGTLVLHGRQGRIRREMPALLAVAVASQRWNPFEAQDEIPYDAIDLVARASAGTLTSEVLHMDGRTVRMVASGSLGIARPHPLELVLGVFFFPGLDWVIDRVPVINRVLLGANRNLMGAYYALEGPFERPRARLIPIKTLAIGPASFVLEDVPGFVWGGLKRIQAVLAPRGDAVVEVPDPPRADS